MNVETAQSQARYFCLRGGTGAVTSGLVWLAAAIVASYYGLDKGFIVLFFGGMLIFPLSTVVDKFIFKRPSLVSGHPSGQIAIESIFPMIGMLFAAWLFLPLRPEFVFPLAAIAIGTRYFGFRTIYGDFSYWILGAAITLIGALSIIFKQPSSELVPFLVAIIEIVFGIWAVVSSIKNDKSA